MIFTLPAGFAEMHDNIKIAMVKVFITSIIN